MFSTYTIGEDGLIHNQTLEIMAVHGCNLACRSCSHASPLLRPKDIADPAAIRADLTRLAGVYRPAVASVLGGEPLLHPDVVGLIAEIRASGISDRVRVVTNGVLIDRQRPEFWDAIDDLWVSVYPGHEPSPEDVANWRTLAAEHNVTVHIYRYDSFRESHSEIGTTDEQLVGRIYATCEFAHVWRCHTVIDGVFYKCPPAYFLGVTQDWNPIGDGITLTENRLRDKVLAYLNSEQPLRACRNCVGSVGRSFPHEEIRRPAWRGPQRRPTEELVDYGYLAEREQGLMPTGDMWYSGEDVLLPAPQG